jgi:hypothetical protein
MIPSKPRHVVLIDGKWQGGSFATADEAKAVGQKLCHGTSKKYEVRPKVGDFAKPSDSKK